MRSIFIAFFLLLSACQSTLTLPELPHPAKRIDQLGYSFMPPEERGWMIMGRTSTTIVLTRKGELPDETQALTIKSQDQSSGIKGTSQLAAQVEGMKEEAPHRFETISQESSTYENTEVSCEILVDVTEDLKPVRRSGKTDSMIMRSHFAVCDRRDIVPGGVFMNLSVRQEKTSTPFDGVDLLMNLLEGVRFQ